MNIIYSSKWRFTHTGTNLMSEDYHRIFDKYKLSDIEEFFDNIDEPAAYRAYSDNNNTLEPLLSGYFGNDIIVDTKFLEMKPSVSYDDSHSCYDDDDEDEESCYDDESIQVTYRFSYMIEIRSKLDINVLKLKYPNMFNDNNAGLRTLLKNRVTHKP